MLASALALTATGCFNPVKKASPPTTAKKPVVTVATVAPATAAPATVATVAPTTATVAAEEVTAPAPEPTTAAPVVTTARKATTTVATTTVATTTATTAAPSAATRNEVQAGVFSSKANAQKQVDILTSKGFAGFAVSGSGTQFRVAKGGLTLDAANALVGKLTSAGIQSFRRTT